MHDKPQTPSQTHFLSLRQRPSLLHGRWHTWLMVVASSVFLSGQTLPALFTRYTMFMQITFYILSQYKVLIIGGRNFTMHYHDYPIETT